MNLNDEQVKQYETIAQYVNSLLDLIHNESPTPDAFSAELNNVEFMIRQLRETFTS
jgi:succinate dehydrogenase flavin-adding protein (antitoxin of CptAB toxin-antitoxin module)